MIRIPSNIEELVSYKPGKPVQQIIEELQLNEWAILWNNENNLGPSPKALQRVREALDTSHVYPDPLSIELRSRIAGQNGCKVENVVVGNGSESIFNNLFRAVFADGDELLTCEGTFVAVYIWAKSNNVPVNKVPLNAGFGFDVQRIVESVTPKTKAVYIANPNNPTGAMISKDELAYLVDQISDDILIIMDEAYFEYALPLSNEYPNSFDLRLPNVLTLRTFSKAYGIAAIRVGYALGEPQIIEALNKVKMTFAPSNLAQAAGIGAIEDRDHLEKTINLNTKALSQFYAAFHDTELKYVPSFGNFVMLDLETPERAKSFTEEMLKKGVFIRHLPAFGLPHCVRISTGTDEENDLLIQRIRELKG